MRKSLLYAATVNRRDSSCSTTIHFSLCFKAGFTYVLIYIIFVVGYKVCVASVGMTIVCKTQHSD